MYSELISDTIVNGGPHASKSAPVKMMRSVKKVCKPACTQTGMYMLYAYTNPSMQRTLVGQYMILIAFCDPPVIWNPGRDMQAFLAVCCTPFMLIEQPLAQTLVERRVCTAHCKSRALSVRRATWV